MKRVINILSRPIILNYTLPIIMVYLVAGTIAQKYIGLYEATAIFFSAPIIWLGVIPLPGLPVFLGIMFINIAFKLIFKSPWTINAGVIITHIGVLLLLVGGMLTVLMSSEGYMDLSKGDKKNYVSDYHNRQLVLLDEGGNQLYAINHDEISQGQVLKIGDFGFDIEIKEYCRNCKIDKRGAFEGDYRGMAQFMELSATQLYKEDEENLSGLAFTIRGSDDDGATFVVLENVPKLPEISINGKTYRFAMRKERRLVPFVIELLEFKREMYSGTELAKAYSSRVRIIDNDSTWESLIRMNEPLRYKGYTLYQSSFIQTPDGDVAVLAVVKNAGRVFPYISGLALSFGILIHLFTRRRKAREE